MAEDLKTTPLSDLWIEKGARMVGFAGYNMPVQFPDGVVKEHLWTLENAGLFDVSHMGPAFFRLIDNSGLTAEEAHIKIATILEFVLPCDIKGLARGQIRYTTLLNADGGILDDLMVARPLNDDEQGSLYIVVNAGGKEDDFNLFNNLGAGDAEIVRKDMEGLIALQGPKAKDVIRLLNPAAADLDFMNYGMFETPYGDSLISRSGYTGEDGFEILVQKTEAMDLCLALLANEYVKPIGLGARDSLRLEAGLCLYGHDLDTNTSPIEAGLAWTIQKRRREAGDFNGAARILSELADGPKYKRVGIAFTERAPAREGTVIQSIDGKVIGAITSGGFSPSLGVPIAMGYVETEYSVLDTEIDLIVRDTPRRAKICKMPFVAHNYYRKS